MVCHLIQVQSFSKKTYGLLLKVN